jgi:hypothetical protein
MYQFKCNNCDIPVCYLFEATDLVTCGNCQQDGTATKLTDQQIIDLDLPTFNGIEVQ